MIAVSPQRLAELVQSFAGRRVLVVGDMVADEYIVGRPVRLSREAPLPVLEWVERYVIPGGAAVVARNLAALGATATVIGVIGQDEPGEMLRQQLAVDGVATDGLTEESARPTSTKTRVIGGSPQVVSQQIARIDRVVRTEIAEATKAFLCNYLRQALPTVDALVISDYENGVINPEIIALALPVAREHRLVTTVDSHGDLWRFRGITVATPNQDEAALTLGRALRTDEDVCQAGRDLIQQMEARGVLITRGSEGMTLVESDGTCHHVPASSLREVRDTTGAGDTVSAVVTLALTAGASMLEAAQLGNVAAGIVVRRLGAATTTPEEMLAELG